MPPDDDPYANFQPPMASSNNTVHRASSGSRTDQTFVHEQDGSGGVELGLSGTMGPVAGEVHVGLAVNQDFSDFQVFAGFSGGPAVGGGAGPTLVFTHDPDTPVASGITAVWDTGGEGGFVAGGFRIKSTNAHDHPELYFGLQTPTEISISSKYGYDFSLTGSDLLEGAGNLVNPAGLPIPTSTSTPAQIRNFYHGTLLGINPM